MFQDTRLFLKKIGLPMGDLMDLPTSKKSFSDGSQFRIEIPTVNSLEAAEASLLIIQLLKLTMITKSYRMQT